MAQFGEMTPGCAKNSKNGQQTAWSVSTGHLLSCCTELPGHHCHACGDGIIGAAIFWYGRSLHRKIKKQVALM